MGQSSVFQTSRSYRWKELGLLIIPGLIFLLITTQLFLANNVLNTIDQQAAFTTKVLPPLQGLIPTLGLIAVLFLAHLVFSFFFSKADQMLFPLVSLLAGIGVLMATRLGRDLGRSLGTQQLLWVALGIIICCVTMAVVRNTDWLARYKYSWAAISFLAVLPSLINGVRNLSSNAPSRDTLGLGPLKLQPSEFLKISIVIFFAAYLSENRDVLAQGYTRLGKLRLPPMRQLAPLLMMLGLALAIFLVVKELGLAMLIYSTFLSLTYLASGRLSYVLSALGAFVVLGAIGYFLLGYVRNRFATVAFDMVNWQHWTDQQQTYASNGGFQLVQGIIALSSGGLFGAGIGLGHPTFVPVIESDMVLSGLGEEMGLMGLFAIIGIYLLIIYRGYRIAMQASGVFNQLLAAGLTTILAVQTLVIMAGNLKLMPLTGIPLPFLSYGGSSILANFIIIGLLLRISHNTAIENGE